MTADTPPNNQPVESQQTAPQIAPQTVTEAPSFGWTQYAEQINGRFAMIGFIALIGTELLTGQDFFTWVGLR